MDLNPQSSALARIRRTFDAGEINPICNHPEVRPWLGGEGPIDVTEVLADQQNIALVDEGFAVIFTPVLQGIYDAHSQALPAYRGRHTLRAARAMLAWMFTRTDAMEVTTYVPHGNVAGRALTMALRFIREYERPGMLGNPTVSSTEFFSLPLQLWQPYAREMIGAGREFHDKLERACKAAGEEYRDHAHDDNHDMYVGCAYEMMRNGQVDKGVWSYSRWARRSQHLPVAILSRKPLVLHLGQFAIQIEDDGEFTVVKGN